MGPGFRRNDEKYTNAGAGEGLMAWPAGLSLNFQSLVDQRPRRQLRLELGDAGLQAPDHRDDVGLVELARDVLRAVDVPRLDGEQQHLLRPGAIALRHQMSQQRRIVLDDAGATPDLYPPPLGIVHQEEEGAVVAGEVAGGDVLPVA